MFIVNTLLSGTIFCNLANIISFMLIPNINVDHNIFATCFFSSYSNISKLVKTIGLNMITIIKDGMDIFNFF